MRYITTVCYKKILILFTYTVDKITKKLKEKNIKETCKNNIIKMVIY